MSRDQDITQMAFRFCSLVMADDKRLQNMSASPVSFDVTYLFENDATQTVSFKDDRSLKAIEMNHSGGSRSLLE